MSSLTFVSMFAGIGGLDLGLERAGHTCVGQVEIDPYCTRVLEKHWPNLWRHDDITTLDPKDIPEADLWVGGFPCQDISNAGKRAGIHGPRSGLFFRVIRLVRQVRPDYVVFENVAAILGRGLDAVLVALAESRYDAEWDTIPAAALGAPHMRDRTFVVAYAQGRGLSGIDLSVRSGRPCEAAVDTAWLREIVPDPHSPRRTDDQGRCARLAEAPKPPPPGAIAGRPGSWWEIEPDVERVVHGVPDALDRVGALGNAVVPQVAEFIGRLLMEAT